MLHLWLNYVKYFFYPFIRIDLEWGEAALGCRIAGICSWHVECHWFYNEFIVCCHCSAPCCFIFSSEIIFCVNFMGKFIKKIHRFKKKCSWIQRHQICHVSNGTHGTRCLSAKDFLVLETFSAPWSSFTFSVSIRIWDRFKCRSVAWSLILLSSSSYTSSCYSHSVLA